MHNTHPLKLIENRKVCLIIPCVSIDRTIFPSVFLGICVLQFCLNFSRCLLRLTGKSFVAGGFGMPYLVMNSIPLSISTLFAVVHFQRYSLKIFFFLFIFLCLALQALCLESCIFLCKMFFF
mgnify:CR=1 FL=1